MGEFTQNLLKLTEFPFSYSLFALLALIFGHGINFQQLSFTEIAPLLILMGFFATTLSIWDPIGDRQRAFIGKGGLAGRVELIFKGKIKPTVPPQFGPIYHDDDIVESLIRQKIFRRDLSSIFFYPVYILAIEYSADLVKKYAIDWDILKESKISIDELGIELKKIGSDELVRIFSSLENLRQRSIDSKWITAEIDRITALTYFAFVVLIFIIALIFLPDFLSIFVKVLGDNEYTRMGVFLLALIAIGVVSVKIAKRLNRLQEKAVTVFNYLTALESIRSNRQDLKTILENIERYLNSNDWILAEYWLTRIMRDYKEMYLFEVKKV